MGTTPAWPAPLLAPERRTAVTEFTKIKMHFTLALLGTLFAIHPFVERIEDYGFDFHYWPAEGTTEYKIWLKIFYVYAAIGGLLAFTVYCYAVSMRTEKQGTWSEKVGNYSYGLAAMILPLYGGLFLSSILAEQMGQSGWAWAVRVAPWVPLTLGALWLIVSQLLAWRLRARLGAGDRQAKLEKLAEQEAAALNRAPEMLASNHYDLSVIELWRALQARLKRALLLHGHSVNGDTPEAVTDAAARSGVLSPEAKKLLQEVRRHWLTAIGTEPVSREAAELSAKAARDILSTIPLTDTRKTAK
jgi:hypothetical protein